MNTTRRDFLCTSGRVLGALAVSAGVQRFGLVNALARPGRLPRARLHLPERRQRRQQHAGAARPPGLRGVRGRAQRLGPGDPRHHAAADHPAERRRALRPAPEPGGAGAALRAGASRRRVQRGAAGGADHPRSSTGATRVRSRTSSSPIPTRCPSGRRPSPTADRRPGGAAGWPTRPAASTAARRSRWWSASRGPSSSDRVASRARSPSTRRRRRSTRSWC